MAQNKSLKSAQIAKNDDFYTQLSDIENELKHYKSHFEGKVVYCNCDDPSASKFYKYFSLNFHELKLKKLITTCYKNQQPDLFSQHNSEKAIWLELEGGVVGEDGAYKPREPVVRRLERDGDFRSPECIELLKQADIVVTNPPFSLFREYIAQLAEYDKKFLIIGNKNAINYKQVFSLFMNDRVWIGVTSMSKDLLFDVPEDYAQQLVETKKEGSAWKRVNGVVKARSQSVWFTNLDHDKRRVSLEPYKTYTPEEYPKYDNYDAIEVSKTLDIPKNFSGVMGVPITYLDRHNPEEFEILGLSQKVGLGLKSTKFYDTYEETRQDGSKTGSSGRKTNGNPVMKGRPKRGNFFVMDNDIVYSLYGRIFIRHRSP